MLILHVILALGFAALPVQEEAPRDADEPVRETTLSPEELAHKREIEAAASERLAEVEGLIIQAWMSRHPSLARARGLEPRDLEVLELGLAARRAWRQAMDAAAGELEGVEWADLGRGRRKDHGWLRAFVQAEDALSDSRPIERWDPGYYLEEAGAVLRGVAGAAELTPRERLRAVTGHVRRLVDVLENAEVELDGAPREAAEHALKSADELSWLLDQGLVELLRPSAPGPDMWRIYQEAREPARAALDRFGTWLREADGRMPRLGKRAWIAQLERRTGAEVDVDALRLRILRDAAEIGAEIGEPRPAARAAPETSAVVQATGKGLTLGFEAARTLGLVAGDAPPTSVRTGVAAGRFGAPLERAWRFNAEGSPSARVTVLASGRAWSATEDEARRAVLTPSGLRAAALQHGYPGELLWEHWSLTSDRALYRGLWNETMRAAWGLYAADWATRVNPDEIATARDPELRREVVRARRVEAVRFYAALLLHAEERSEAEVAHEIAGLLGLPRELAELEARKTRLDPLRGAGYLGYLELRRVEENLHEHMSEFEAASWVGRIVRQSPSAPPGRNIAEEVAAMRPSEPAEQDEDAIPPYEGATVEEEKEPEKTEEDVEEEGRSKESEE